MYPKFGVFSPQETLLTQGAEPYGDPSQTIKHPDLTNDMASGSGANLRHPTGFFSSEDIGNLRRQFGFNMKQEASINLMQACEYQQFLNSAALSNPPQPMIPLPDIFSGELLAADSALVASAILYDDFANQASMIRDHVFHAQLPQDHGYLHGLEEGIHGGQFDDDHEFSPQSRERKQVRSFKGNAQEKGSSKTEKQRRERSSQKFEMLKSLIPCPSKHDRASTVADAIEYISELQRTIKELKMLVELKKRRVRSKTLQAGEDEAATGDVESSSMNALIDDRGGCDLRGPLRSSWLRRRSKETVVDVRIVEDEVTIKFTQQRKASCLLIVSKVLDELELELIHFSGGIIGDCHIFMFNTKIHQGSSLYASAIATRLIEAMEVKCQALPVGF